MQFPTLHITSTRALLGLNRQAPLQTIEQPRASQEIKQPKAEQNFQSTKPSLSIETTEMRAELDLKSVFLRTEEFAQQGKDGASEGTARRASEGQQLMMIENGANPIVDQSSSRGRQMYSGLGIRFVPSYGSVKVDFKPGSIDIQVEPNAPLVNVQVNKVIHNYTPGKLTGEMLQHSSLDITWSIPEMTDIKL